VRELLRRSSRASREFVAERGDHQGGDHQGVPLGGHRHGLELVGATSASRPSAATEVRHHPPPRSAPCAASRLGDVPPPPVERPPSPATRLTAPRSGAAHAAGPSHRPRSGASPTRPRARRRPGQLLR
jgi:hypothetical protein